MRRMVAITLLMAVAAIGCTDDEDDSTTTTTSESTTTTSESTTTTVAETTSTTVPAPEPLPTIPADYATGLIRAWEVGDRAEADRYATAEAADTLFAYESGGAGAWSLENCEGAAGSSYCTFTAGGDPRITVRVLNEMASLGQPQAVTEVVIEP